MLESESVAPELINQYIEACGTSISYTKTKDRASVARLNRFCRRIELWAEDYIPDTILQKHLMRRFNNDLFTVSGQYVKSTDMLERGFREHYRTDRVFQYQMVNVNIRLSLDIPCYRRIRIPLNSSLAELHHIIQLLFCWQDYHLHEFRTEMNMPLDILFPEYSFLARETQYGDLDYTKMESVIFCRKYFLDVHPYTIFMIWATGGSIKSSFAVLMLGAILMPHAAFLPKVLLRLKTLAE